MSGCDIEFYTTNYGVKTTPRKEYEISTGLRECPEEDMRDRSGRKQRVIQRIDALKTLEICRRSQLSDDEILAVVGILEIHRFLRYMRSFPPARASSICSN